MSLETRDQPSQQPARSANWAAYLGLAFLLALSGCTPVKVRLGWKVYLDKIPITSMEVRLPKGPGIAPGEKSPLVVMVTEPDGKVLQTEGKGGGKVLWKDLKVTASVVTANQKGIVSLPRDPRISDGKVGQVTITVPSHPDIRAELDIPLRYDYNFISNFSGRSGSSGMSGSDGLDGSSGSSGSTDPNNPSAGGDGSNGGNGSDGQDGGPGGDAPPVQVRVALRAGSHPLLQVGVSAAGHQKLYLVDPQGGSLTVKADGGPGGSGGKGRKGRPRRLRRHGNAQREQREQRLRWTERLGWVAGERRKHHRDVRSASQALLECDPTLQQGWPPAGIQGRTSGCLVVSVAHHWIPGHIAGAGRLERTPDRPA